MLRRTSLKILGGATLVGGLSVTGRARAAEVIKIGTLAPKSSPWGKVCEDWIKAVSEKTGGKLELQLFYGGAQGEEDGTYELVTTLEGYAK